MAQVIDLGGHLMRAQHAGAALLLSLVAAAPAAADTRDVFHFADPFDGTAQCDGFVNNWEGHDRGTVTNFARNGVLYRQVGHIHAIETDTNSVTGKSVVIRTNITIVGDLSPAGDLLAHKVSGEFNIGNSAGQGIVIHDAGMLRIDEAGLVTTVHGIHDVFANGEDAFCEALS
jgi:hypothetical protein